MGRSGWEVCYFFKRKYSFTHLYLCYWNIPPCHLSSYWSSIAGFFITFLWLLLGQISPLPYILTPSWNGWKPKASSVWMSHTYHKWGMSLYPIIPGLRSYIAIYVHLGWHKGRYIIPSWSFKTMRFQVFLSKTSTSHLVNLSLQKLSIQGQRTTHVLQEIINQATSV
jgi:hypothetical protein